MLRSIAERLASVPDLISFNAAISVQERSSQNTSAFSSCNCSTGFRRNVAAGSGPHYSWPGTWKDCDIEMQPGSSKQLAQCHAIHPIDARLPYSPVAKGTMRSDRCDPDAVSLSSAVSALDLRCGDLNCSCIGASTQMLAHRLAQSFVSLQPPDGDGDTQCCWLCLARMVLSRCDYSLRFLM